MCHTGGKKGAPSGQRRLFKGFLAEYGNGPAVRSAPQTRPAFSRRRAFAFQQLSASARWESGHNQPGSKGSNSHKTAAEKVAPRFRPLSSSRGGVVWAPGCSPTSPTRQRCLVSKPKKPGSEGSGGASPTASTTTKATAH